MIAFIRRWWQFLRERHDPFGITLTVAAFYGANVLMGRPSDPGFAWDPVRLAAGFAVVWLVFLHMRLFDEVKDYAVDREHNPERPLARGLIGLGEFGTVTLLVILVELSIAANMGWASFTTMVMTLCFTLMMRMEFFVGDWMRPKLEIYAITHTFSATMLGFLSFSMATGRPLVACGEGFALFALGNWFVFNVFEFGRKTFGREEERDGVDSYSLRLKPAGAVVLLIVNMLTGYGLLTAASSFIFPAWPKMLLGGAGALVLLVTLAGIKYASSPTTTDAKLYRGVVTLYLLGYHIAILTGVIRAWAPPGPCGM